MRSTLLKSNESLIDSARDRDAEVRMTAIRGLGGISPKVTDAAPSVLVAALKTGRRKSGARAAQALLHFHRGLLDSSPRSPAPWRRHPLDSDQATWSS